MHKNYHFVDYFALLTCHLFSSLNLKHSDGTGLININLLVYIMQNYSNTENVRKRNGSDNWGVSKNVLFQTLFIDFNIWFFIDWTSTLIEIIIFILSYRIISYFKLLQILYLYRMKMLSNTLYKFFWIVCLALCSFPICKYKPNKHTCISKCLPLIMA